jgi:hypothetical protein
MPKSKMKSIKRPRQYEALRRKGLSKQLAARISNSSKRKRKRRKRR